MGRWEPDARERLEHAALALFVEHGYQDTTVSQIADRAGLTRSTFFRHFADKREVIFGGQDFLADLFAGAVGAAAPAASIVDCLAAALQAAATVAFTAERHFQAVQGQAVIAANSELQERALLKRAGLSLTIAQALRDRQIDDTSARLGAEVVVLAFATAITRWTQPHNQRPFAGIAHEELHELRARAAALGAEDDHRPND